MYGYYLKSFQDGVEVEHADVLDLSSFYCKDVPEALYGVIITHILFCSRALAPPIRDFSVHTQNT